MGLTQAGWSAVPSSRSKACGRPPWNSVSITKERGTARSFVKCLAALAAISVFGVLPNFPVAYVGHDWRFRFVQIDPVKAYSIISDALGTLRFEDCALPNVGLNLASSSNVPKSWQNALELERAAAAAVSSN